MSTNDGVANIVSQVVADAKDRLSDSQDPAQQLDLLDQPSPEQMLRARMQLGPDASSLSVLDQARNGRSGRPPGARNKRTDDFARYILSFGQDPAITLMQIQSTPPEVLMENSRRLQRSRRTKDGRQIDVMQSMSYEAAQSLRKQCAAELMPYIHAKRPMAVDMTFSGVADLVIEGVTHSREEIGEILDGDFMPVDDDGAEE